MGSGNDTIEGGAGNDTLVGGRGAMPSCSGRDAAMTRSWISARGPDRADRELTPREDYFGRVTARSRPLAWLVLAGDASIELQSRWSVDWSIETIA